MVSQKRAKGLGRRKDKSLWLIVAKEFKKVLFPLAYVTLLIAAIIIIRPSLPVLFGIILGGQILITIAGAVYKREMFDVKKLIKTLFKTTIILIVIISALKYLLVWWGIIGYFIFILGYAAYRLIRNRKQYMATLREIETIIWGKPLDRKFEKEIGGKQND